MIPHIKSRLLSRRCLRREKSLLPVGYFPYGTAYRYSGCTGRITKPKGRTPAVLSAGIPPGRRTARGGTSVLFVIHSREFVARSPVFLHRPALWQQREGIRRIFDTPSTSSSARGRYWRFVQTDYTTHKRKREENNLLPVKLFSLMRKYAEKRRFPLPAAPDGSGSGPEWRPPAPAGPPG